MQLLSQEKESRVPDQVTTPKDEIYTQERERGGKK